MSTKAWIVKYLNSYLVHSRPCHIYTCYVPFLDLLLSETLSGSKSLFFQFLSGKKKGFRSKI